MPLYVQTGNKKNMDSKDFENIYKSSNQTDTNTVSSKQEISNSRNEKIEIVLAWFTKEDIELIKTYVILRGFDVAIVKAD